MKGAIQLGIGYTVGNLTSKPDRDVLMQDFYVVESVFLPRLVICNAKPLRHAFILYTVSLTIRTLIVKDPINE